jgi:hypothetical protein
MLNEHKLNKNLFISDSTFSLLAVFAFYYLFIVERGPNPAGIVLVLGFFGTFLLYLLLTTSFNLATSYANKQFDKYSKYRLWIVSAMICLLPLIFVSNASDSELKINIQKVLAFIIYIAIPISGLIKTFICIFLPKN